MSNKKILMNLISTYGSLNEDQNKKIINDFINFYNSNTDKPINDYALKMFFKYHIA